MAKFKIGLTGGIASGKSFIKQYLKSKNHGVVDADALVLELYADPNFHQEFKKQFPDFKETVTKENVRSYLKKHPEKILPLENLIHPLLHLRFLELSKNEKGIFFYEATLILEKNLLDRFDFCLVALCPETVRKTRFLKRVGAKEETFTFFTRHQIPDDEREKLCSTLPKLVGIDTSMDESHTIAQIEKFLSGLPR